MARMRTTTFFLHPEEASHRMLFVQPLDGQMQMTRAGREGRRKGWNASLILVSENTRSIMGSRMLLNYDLGMEFTFMPGRFAQNQRPARFTYPFREEIVGMLRERLDFSAKRIGPCSNRHDREAIVVEQTVAALQKHEFQGKFAVLLKSLNNRLSKPGRSSSAKAQEKMAEWKSEIEASLAEFLDTQTSCLGAGGASEHF
jgi:hypothetical protein